MFEKGNRYASESPHKVIIAKRFTPATYIWGAPLFCTEHDNDSAAMEKIAMEKYSVICAVQEVNANQYTNITKLQDSVPNWSNVLRSCMRVDIKGNKRYIDKQRNRKPQTDKIYIHTCIYNQIHKIKIKKIGAGIDKIIKNISFKIDTVKPVYNDHLYNKIYYLSLIQ